MAKKWEKPLLSRFCTTSPYTRKLFRACIVAWDREVQELYAELKILDNAYELAEFEGCDVDEILSGDYVFE